jgi:hypothetical protein
MEDASLRDPRCGRNHPWHALSPRLGDATHRTLNVFLKKYSPSNHPAAWIGFNFGDVPAEMSL